MLLPSQQKVFDESFRVEGGGDGVVKSVCVLGVVVWVGGLQSD